jgi:signal transduction histidine kinase
VAKKSRDRRAKRRIRLAGLFPCRDQSARGRASPPWECSSSSPYSSPFISIYIDSNDRQASSEATLADERKTAELREQFVGVLGHDLRNPLASIEGEAQLLMRRRSTTGRRVIVEMMRNGVARMSELINNVLDLTQARLGGGFQLNRANEGGLGPNARTGYCGAAFRPA